MKSEISLEIITIYGDDDDHVYDDKTMNLLLLLAH